MQFVTRIFTSGAVLLCAVTSAAQTPSPRPERPYRGLFGGGVGNAEQVLTVSATLGGGYDDNVFADQGGSRVGSTDDPRYGQSGSYGQLSGEVSYSLDRRRLSFGASAGASTRYYSEGVDDLLGAYNGTIGASLRFSERHSLTGSQSIGYQPYVQLGLFPQLFDPGIGDASVPSLDLGTARQDFYSYSSNLEYTRGVWRRGTFAVSYNRQLSDFESLAEDFTRQGALVRYSHGISRGLGVRFGYGYSEGRYAVDDGLRTTSWQTWDIGVDYSRALSFSRRTKLSFATGSAAIGDRDRTHYRLTGDASLIHEIGRTWNAALAYSRGVGFVETFSEPFFSDSVTLSLGGMMSRRLEFQAAAGGSLGSVGLTGNSEYDTYYARTGVTFALTRHLGAGSEYFYYRYHFDPGTLLPSGIASEMDRHGVRAHLAVWVPLFHRARRPDAAR